MNPEPVLKLLQGQCKKAPKMQFDVMTKIKDSPAIQKISNVEMIEFYFAKIKKNMQKSRSFEETVTHEFIKRQFVYLQMIFLLVNRN